MILINAALVSIRDFKNIKENTILGFQSIAFNPMLYLLFPVIKCEIYQQFLRIVSTPNERNWQQEVLQEVRKSPWP